MRKRRCAGARRLAQETALAIEHGQEREADAGGVGRGHDALRHLGDIVVRPAVGLVMQVVELGHPGEARLEHLHVGIGGDRLEVVRRQPLDEAIHRSRQVQKESASLAAPRSVRPAMARWKAWLCRLGRPGSTTPETRWASPRPGSSRPSDEAVVDRDHEVAPPAVGRQRQFRGAIYSPCRGLYGIGQAPVEGEFCMKIVCRCRRWRPFSSRFRRLGAAAGAQPDARRHQGARPHRMRRASRPAGLLLRQRQGRVDRPRRRLLQGAGRRRAGRRHQGEVHADLGAAALADPAVGPGRPAVAQHHHHLLAQRHARRELPGHQFLRGPDLHRAHLGQRRRRSKDLDGATVCVAAGSTEEKNAADWFRERNLKVTIINFQKNDDAISAYDAGRCDAYTAGVGALAGQRIKLKDPGRPPDPDRADLERSAGAGDALGRRALAAGRALGAERHDRRRGARRHLEERRRDEGEVDQRRGPPPARRRGRLRRDDGPRRTTGCTTPSSRSGTTARATSAPSAWARRSSSKRGKNELWTKGGLLFTPPFQ